MGTIIAYSLVQLAQLQNSAICTRVNIFVLIFINIRDNSDKINIICIFVKCFLNIFEKKEDLFLYKKLFLLIFLM